MVESSNGYISILVLVDSQSMNECRNVQGEHSHKGSGRACNQRIWYQGTVTEMQFYALRIRGLGLLGSR